MSSDPPPTLPLPTMKSPRPFSFANEPYLPPDPSRFTHFMPSPIASTRPLDSPLHHPYQQQQQQQQQPQPYSQQLSASTSAVPSPVSYKRSFLESDTASPEAGSSFDEDRLVKEEEDLDDKSGSGRALKQTKRAAQNRAAQQAFRKRKEERIRELEDKEKLLHQYQHKERELVRREQELLEREQLFALRQIKAEAFPQQQQQHSQQLPQPQRSQQSSYLSVPSPAPIPDRPRAEEDAQLRDAHKMLLDAQVDYNEAKRQIHEADLLVAALRRSLEDLGAENRGLRSRLAVSPQDYQQQQQQQQSNQASGPSQQQQQIPPSEDAA